MSKTGLYARRRSRNTLGMVLAIAATALGMLWLALIMATLLRHGLGALGPEIDGALVCLGDMPRVTPQMIDRLIQAFDPLEGRAICVPTANGKRGSSTPSTTGPHQIPGGNTSPRFMGSAAVSAAALLARRQPTTSGPVQPTAAAS